MAAAWVVAALLGAAALASVAARRRDGDVPQLIPQLLSFAPVMKLDASRVQRASSQYVAVTSPPRIPAAALAAAATKALYAGAYDNLLPQMRDLANEPTLAENSRGTIVGALWQGINVGMDGAPYGKATWEQQHLRFNIAAIAIQDALSETRQLPLSLFGLLRPLTDYPYLNPEQLAPPAQWLAYRYARMCHFDCTDWDLVWVQGHTAQQIYGRAPHAVGANEDSCRALRAERLRFLYERMGKLYSDPSYTQVAFINELAAQTLDVAKKKIVIWPGGPAVSPYVDWGWVVGALVRMYTAAARGDVDELAGIAEEAGDKAREAAADPGEDYGSAELNDDLSRYAEGLAERL